ncbi:nucleoside-diphosphate kinase [Candidatus Purcelliella pentastirinorum]|uniref:Nucleoside diphosphate kinase n=1 Tax=Candidatus Purcelliella pentastirinorum TaxID=472834 RepID=A0AAX3N7E2_9ENTR|nr:nucleoside-diphosphate kinase [Candidatus Purcelliella pentastirinorum]WDI78459.1 nucleoside-diphosphate kinase [Candidatus Purcelliella pentastirinorum]WDR80512.1 nucleoside-diphosphate kinase [Candidatus Purcelliella pentastirinorum]
MNVEHTLLIIKPNSVFNNIIGEIYSRFERSGFKIIATKMLFLNKYQAKSFYIIHKDKCFFNDLVDFMSSGPIVVSVLECKDAVRRNRELIGHTDPSLALAGTIRSDYSDNLIKNAVHGSDSNYSAYREIKFFFSKNEIFSRFVK